MKTHAHLDRRTMAQAQLIDLVHAARRRTAPHPPTPASDTALHARVAPTGRWSVDATNSSVEFLVKHMLVASFKGRFTEFEGTLEVMPDGVATAFGKVSAASIDTNESVRDERLRRSAEFFDVERYPEISYSSRRIEPLDSSFRIAGELTMRGITHELDLGGQARGPEREASGKLRIAISLRGELSRSQFGITWNEVLDKGGVLVADKVRISLHISAVQQTGSDHGQPALTSHTAGVGIAR